MRKSRNGLRPITITRFDTTEIKGYFINFHTISYPDNHDWCGGTSYGYQFEQLVTAEKEDGSIYDGGYCDVRFDDIESEED